MQKTNHFFLFHSIVAIQKQILLQTNQKIGEQKNQIPKLKRNIKSSYSTVTEGGRKGVYIHLQTESTSSSIVFLTSKGLLTISKIK